MKCVSVTPIQNRSLTFQPHIWASHLYGLPLSPAAELSWQGAGSLHTLCPWPGMPLPPPVSGKLPPLSLCPGSVLREACLCHSLASDFPLLRSLSSTCTVTMSLYLKGGWDQTDSALLRTPPTLGAPSVMFKFNCCQTIVFPCPGRRIPEPLSQESPAQALLWLSNSVSSAFSSMFQMSTCRQPGETFHTALSSLVLFSVCQPLPLH